MVNEKNSYEIKTVAMKSNLPFIEQDLRGYSIPDTTLEKIDKCTARNSFVLPLGYEERENLLTVVTSNTAFIGNVHQLAKAIGCRIQLSLAETNNVVNAINHFYNLYEEMNPQNAQYCSNYTDIFFKTTTTSDVSVAIPEAVEAEDLPVEEGPVIQMVNQIFEDAVRARASDIHIEPVSDGVLIRFRIDGRLNEISKLEKKYMAPLISRFKLIGKMDPGFDLKGQDGEVSLIIEGKQIDVRVSSLPELYGEKIVTRLQSREKLLTFGEVGLPASVEENLKKILKRQKGIVFVTGPTGSGKSTTLGASLEYLVSPELNIQSIEDPIELRIKGVNQSQVRHNKIPELAMTFADALRTILRQDPDIIMVGEIRDDETAEIAVRAAITGHLVLTTCHTNNTVGVVSRLMDQNVSLGLILQAVNGVLDQRLVRCLCPKCKEVEPNPDLGGFSSKEKHLIQTSTVYRAKVGGCKFCNSTGIKGRTVVAEFLAFTNTVKRIIKNDPHDDVAIYTALREQLGHKTIRDHAIDLLLKGTISLEEALTIEPVWEVE